MRLPLRARAIARASRVFLALLLLAGWVFSGWPRLFGFPPDIRLALAAASVTAATGGSTITADTTGGTYATLTGPTITEGANGDIAASGTIVLSVPSGFVFNTGATVTATITRDAGSKSCFTFTSTTATPTATTITFTANAKDGTGGSPATTCHVTFSNVQVRPSAGTPLASGNITQTGTNAGAPGGATNYGTLTEVAGSKNKLAVTTQPSSTAVFNTDFLTKPVVALQDQFGNTVTNNSTSTIARTAVLSSQSCGGTAGSGTLTSTPASGSAVSSGVLTYTAMQYSVGESIKICFTSSGVTSALSNAVTVVGLPTVTTQAATNIALTSATGNGNLTATGGENNDKHGVVYDTSSKSLPGNVAPGSSGYASFAESAGSFGTGAFTQAMTGLSSGTTYYTRAYSHDTAGYSYGGEVSFTTTSVVVSVTVGDAAVAYGFVAAGNSKSTSTGMWDTQTATNTGNVAEDFSISGSNSADWTLASSAGSEQYKHAFCAASCTSPPTNYTALTTGAMSLASNVAVGSAQAFDLNITVPTSTSHYGSEHVDVTIVATQH